MCAQKTLKRGVLSYSAFDVQKTTWRRIADDVSARIASGELAVGLRIESEEEMAARLGVSRHTAHRALHEFQRQGLVVRQRRWGTVIADRSAEPPKGRIAYLVDWTGNRFQADVMTHIEHALEDGARLVVATSRNDPEREAENLLKLRDEVDGIVCYPCDGDGNADAFRTLADSGYPLVLVDRAPRGCEDFVVLTDNEAATQEAVADLIKRGHRRIAFFGTNNPSAQSIRERFLGYRAAVRPLAYATKAYERWIPVHLDGKRREHGAGRVRRPRRHARPSRAAHRRLLFPGLARRRPSRSLRGARLGGRRRLRHRHLQRLRRCVLPPALAARPHRSANGPREPRRHRAPARADARREHPDRPRSRSRPLPPRRDLPRGARLLPLHAVPRRPSGGTSTR